MSENEAIPRQVINHKNRFHDAGIFLEKLSPRNLASVLPITISHVFETAGTAARSVCRLSRFSLEKHARAGISIEAKLSTTQKASH